MTAETIRERCLLCHWEPNKPDEGDHIPEVIDEDSGVYVCFECETRTKTVSSFGLTVEELRKAAAAYKATAPLPNRGNAESLP
jgi:hypothetical protein